MKGVKVLKYLVPVICGAVSVGIIDSIDSIHADNIRYAEKNIEQLEWMQSHEFPIETANVNPKTAKNSELIEDFLEEQREWVTSWRTWNIAKSAPNVNWKMLPMDNKCAHKFYEVTLKK